MMRWIVDSSLRFRRLVLAVAAGVMIVGVTQVGKSSVDVLPEFNPPTVEVQTEALGLSAAEVEQLITVPLEQDLLAGVAFLHDIESVSLPGLSSVVMTFQPGTDLLDARQVVQERLSQAVGVAGLPEVAKPPQMIQPLSSQSRVSMVKLSSKTLTPIEVSVLARWVISPRLMGVPGVANVTFWGNRERQLQVLVDPAQLRQSKTTLAQIIATAGNALEVSPLSFLEASTPGTGGFIDTLNQRLNIFHEQAITTAEKLAQVPLEPPDGVTASASDRATRATLGDVSKVVENHQPLIGDAVCAGDDQCLLLVVEKFPGSNTVEVTRGIESALAALRPGLADMQIDSSVYRPASFIESSFENLGRALLIGGLLMVLLIGLFFWDWRRTVVATAAIAVSLAAAAFVLYLRDTPINFLVVAGLVLGVTAAIHDAVTDLDGLVRRLRTSRRGLVRQDLIDADRPTPDGGLEHSEENPNARAWRSIVAAAVETRSGMFYALLIVAAATLPFFFMRGEGQVFLPPIALSYLLAAAASMVVALTVTPVLALMLLSRAPGIHSESPISFRLRRRYHRVASRAVTRTRIAFALCAGLAAVGLVAVPFLHVSLRPSLKEQQVLVRVEAPPGISLPRMTDITRRAVEELDALPGVANVGGHVGRAVMSDQRVDVNSGEIWVSVDPAADYAATVAAIDDTVGRNPDVSTEVLTYSDQRVTEVLQRSRDDVVVRIYGEDAKVRSEKADEVRSLIAEVDGVAAVNVGSAPVQPTMEVEVDLARAQRYGVKPGDVRRAAASLLAGITVGHLFQEQKVFDVVVWGAPDIRQSERDIEQLLIDTPNGGHVRLGEVADVRSVPNTAVIRRESVSTYVDVTADVAGRDVGAVASEIDGLLEQVSFPLEHHAELLGGYTERTTDTQRLITVALAAGIAIVLLLQAAFRSWRLAVLSFLILPLALSGGVVAAFLAGGTITLGSIAGFVGVLGIAARGLVMQVRHYQRLERTEGGEFGPELVLRATREDLVPMLLSTLATAAVLAPIAVMGPVPGFEIVHPMVIAVLGGLVTTTVVNLLIVPVLYLRYGFGRQPDTWTDELFEPIPETELARG